jgi:hypothetical protein
MRKLSITLQQTTMIEQLRPTRVYQQFRETSRRREQQGRELLTDREYMDQLMQNIYERVRKKYLPRHPEGYLTNSGRGSCLVIPFTNRAELIDGLKKYGIDPRNQRYYLNEIYGR